jgi:chitin synthase
MTPYLKGPLVWDPKTVASQAQGAGRLWAIIEDQVYDLTDYYNTVRPISLPWVTATDVCMQITLVPNNPGFNFLNSQFASLWQGQSGTDITTAIAALNLSPSVLKANMDCVKTLFYVGQTDFRLTARCQVQPYLLLTFSLIIVTTILAKFLAALQLGSKRSPELRDKFVICQYPVLSPLLENRKLTRKYVGQVPCYTEGEESLKKTIDSLATLTYDDKRKLLLIICDGMIIGSGNDRPTPRIVLDILGVDQSVDPDPLMFKSISEGSKQLNYGKVWSGLYEVDGREFSSHLSSCISLTVRSRRRALPRRGQDRTTLGTISTRQPRETRFADSRDAFPQPRSL